MRRLPAYLLILCFCVPTAHAGVAVLAGGAGFATKTFTGVTGNLDNVTGFYTDGSLDLRSFYGRYATFTASAGNTIKFRIGGQSAPGETYGSNLITNGNFTSDTGWIKGANWSISAGFAVASNVSNPNTIYQIPTLTRYALYMATATFVVTGGQVQYILGNNGNVRGTPITSSGTYTQYINDSDSSPSAQGLVAVTSYPFTGTVTGFTNYQVLTPSNGTTSGAFGAYFNGAGAVTGSPYNASIYTVTISAY
jgi:hypothetical protein